MGSIVGEGFDAAGILMLRRRVYVAGVKQLQTEAE